MALIDYLNIVSEHPEGNPRLWLSFSLVRKDEDSLFYGESSNSVRGDEMTEFPSSSFGTLMNLMKMKLKYGVKGLSLICTSSKDDPLMVIHRDLVFRVREFNYTPATGLVMVQDDKDAPVFSTVEDTELRVGKVIPLNKLIKIESVAESLDFADSVASNLGVEIAKNKTVEFYEET